MDVLLDRARAATRIAERRFALDALARGLLLADPGTIDAATREAALALRVDPSTVSAAHASRLPHAVPVPLVAGDDLAFVRQVLVVFDPVGLLADGDPLEPGARRAVARAIDRAALRTPPTSDPALHRLVAARPRALAAARVEGPSLAAAAYLSAVSLWTGRAIRDGVVVTGALEGDAVVSVGAMPEKVRAARDHGAERLLVPAADAAVAAQVAAHLGATLEVVGVADLAALEAHGLAADGGRRASPEREVADARREFSTGWRGFRWPTIQASLSRLSGTLPAGRVDLRVEVLCRLAAAQRHLGDPVGALALLDEAHAIVRSPEGEAGVPDDPLAYLLQQTAMTDKQLCRFAEARRAARDAAEVARRARLRGVLIKALGVVGLVALADGDPKAAIEAFEESLAVTLAFDPHRTARTRAYLIEAHGAAGNHAAAAAQLDAAMEELEASGDDEGRRATESWVRTSWGGALHALGRAADAVAALDVPSVHASLEGEPLPGLIARRWLGLALTETDGGAARGYELLAASPVVHGRALAPHLSFLAHLNVLFEAAARAAQGAWGPDVAGRAVRALEQVPSYGLVDRAVRDAHRVVGAALERGDAPPDAALATLLAQCRRLA
ncbi:MAG: hypothetical protein H6719_31810 [Sandaracinaceae bacterium]|nr:hypothetical protein [Sandaracinaceae bacterium]